MVTLYRYIIRLYLTNIVLLMIVLFGFVVTVDVLVNLGRFYKAAVSTDATDPGFIRAALLTMLGVVRLWAPRLLQLFVYLNGVILVGAMGFTCAQLVRHREFVALLASGISLYRVARPFVLVALLMTCVQAAVHELMVPAIAPLLARDVSEAFKDDTDPYPVRLMPDGQGRLFYAHGFDPTAGTLQDLIVWERDHPAGGGGGAGSARPTRVVTADAAKWDGAGWVLTKGLALPPTALGAARERAKASSPGSAAPSVGVPITRLDSPLDPTTMRVRTLASFGEALSTHQLTQVISGGGLDTKATDRLKRIAWGRYAGLVGNLVTLLAAMPFFLQRVPTPMLIPSLRAAPVAIGGLAVGAAGAGIALPGLPIWLGAFVPCLLMLPVSVALFTGIKT